MTVRSFTAGRCSRDCQRCKALSPTASSGSPAKMFCLKDRDAPTPESMRWLKLPRLRLESPIPERNLVIALNDILPASVRVNSVELVPDDFHARHSAKAKTYRYRIYRGDICPPFLAKYVCHDPYPMDEEALMRSSEHIVGKHDFTSFAATDPDRNARMKEGREDDAPSSFGTPTNIRTIHSSQWARTEEELIYTVRGDGFLHHMVRNLVGTFLLVGKGTLKIDDVPAILEARNRSAAGPTAAARGLYLVSVEY